MSDCLQMQLMFDVPALGIFRAQEFATRRHIIKKRAYFDLRAGRFPAVANDVDLAAINDNLVCRLLLEKKKCQAKSRHAGDARQGFAAKTERTDCFQIRNRSDL